jgi:hypothetical protein
MNNRLFLIRATMFVGLLLLLVSCTQVSQPTTSATPTVDSTHLTAFARSYPTATPTHTPMVASAANVEPAPQDCPLGPPLPVQRISPAIAPLGGISPVWATVGGNGTGHLAGDLYDADGGWPVKIVWEVGPNYHGIVTLRAGNLRTGTLLKWKLFPDDQVTMSPVLDPQHPGHPVSVIGPNWNEWGSAVLIPAAGCYYLEARWPQGQWRDTFAFGL